MNSQTLQLSSLTSGSNLKIVSARAPDRIGKSFDAKHFLRLFEKALSYSGKVGAQRSRADGSRTVGHWLDLFKKALASLSEKTQDAFFSFKGMDALRNLLLREGFSKDDVETFLKQLFNGAGGKEVKLSELLQKISEFRKAKKVDGDALQPAPSTIPHLETTLRCFGLDALETGRVLNKARSKGQGLDLEELARRLKAVLSQGRTGFDLGKNEVSGQEVKKILKVMGMKEEASAIQGPVSFKEFVQIIAARAAGGLKNFLSDGETENGVKSLLKHVRFSEKKTDTSAFSMSRKGGPFQQFGTNPMRKNTASQQRRNHSPIHRKPIDANDESSAKRPRGISDRQLAEFEKWVPSREHDTAEIQALFDRREHQAMHKTSEKNGVMVSRSGRMASAARNLLTPPPTGPEARSIPLHVMEQVGRRLGLALKRGETHVRLQLKPPDLGSIQLDLAMKDNGVRIAMVAEHQAVKDLILLHAHELKQALMEQGVAVQRFDVEINYNFGHSMADSWGNFPKASRWTPGMNNSAQDVDSDVSATQAAARAAPHTDTLLDMFA